jgi:hypothetical protein
MGNTLRWCLRFANPRLARRHLGIFALWPHGADVANTVPNLFPTRARIEAVFPDAVPRIRRLPSTGFAPQYEGIFQVNIQAARQILGFQGCLDNITQRLRGIIHALYVLNPAEHEEARRSAYLIAETRGGGRLPPYDPASASDDFYKAAGQVIAIRT